VRGSGSHVVYSDGYAESTHLASSGRKDVAVEPRLSLYQLVIEGWGGKTSSFLSRPGRFTENLV